MKPKNTLTAFLRSLSFCIYFLLLAFTTGDSKSEYILPLHAASVCAKDLDLDGDIDILVGHNYDFNTQWSGISIMLNDGNGYLDLFDSIYLFGGQTTVNAENLNENPLPEIIGKYVTLNPASEYISIVYDLNENNIAYFNLFTDDGVDYLETGDVNGDSNIDIVVASNNGKFWGVLYNEGNGNFSAPTYYSTAYWPNDLAVGDIDGNGRDDIAITGQNTEIFYSFELGFEYYLLSGTEHSIEIADMDNDGDIDISTVWGAGTTSYLIYENLGYQNFQQHIVYIFQYASGGLRVPVLNNDSLPDITFMDGVNYYILYNNGEFEFSEPDTILPNFSGGDQTYLWADVDNNNYQDILIIREYNTYVPNLKILFNDGNGHYGEDPITCIQTSDIKHQTQNLYCYPNPFSTETTIEINIKDNDFAELSVYSLSGKKFKTLTYHNIEGGITKIKWDGLDNKGNLCTPGTYLLTLKVKGDVLQTIKLIKY